MGVFNMRTTAVAVGVSGFNIQKRTSLTLTDTQPNTLTFSNMRTCVPTDTANLHPEVVGCSADVWVGGHGVFLYF